MNEPDQDTVELKKDEMNPIPLEFAPAWKRVLSFLIDTVIMRVVLSFMIFAVYRDELAMLAQTTDIVKQTEQMTQFIASHIPITIADFILQMAYFTLLWRGSGQTLGARILGIAVISVDKKRLGIFQGMLRYSTLAVAAMAFYLPLIFVVNPVYQMRFHDLFSGSVVVNLPRVTEKD